MQDPTNDIPVVDPHPQACPHGAHCNKISTMPETYEIQASALREVWIRKGLRIFMLSCYHSGNHITDTP